MQKTTNLATTVNNTISTNDWDTVSALTYAALNAAIVSQKSSPPSFSQDGSSGLIGPYTVSANFGDWQLVEGGDGQNVWMNLPMNSGKAIFNTLGQNYTFSGSVIIEIKMNYIPQPESDNGTPHNLQVKTSSSDITVPVVSVEVIQLLPTDLDPTVTEIIQGALVEWLTNNLQDFNQVFAVADLNVVLAEDEPNFQWLKPTHVSYAVTDKGSLDTSVFGVLAMTSNASAPTSHQVSPDTIPAGNNGGFLLSQALFMNEMILPGVYMMFNGSTADNFIVNNDNSQVTNTVPLSFSLGGDDGSVYPTKVNTQNFKITLLGKQLTVNFTDLNYESGLGVYTHINYQAVYQVTMNDQHQLEMYMVGDPTLYTSITLSTARTWTDIGISVALSVAGAVVGAVVGGMVDVAIDAAAQAAVDEASEALADAAAQAAADGSTEVGTTIIVDGVAESVNAPEQIVADAAVAAPDMAANAAGEVAFEEGPGFLRRFGVKILGSMVGGAAGAVAGSIPMIVANIGKQANDYPTLDNFAEQVISSVEWPNSSGYEMESAELNGSLQIGFNFDIL